MILMLVLSNVAGRFTQLLRITCVFTKKIMYCTVEADFFSLRMQQSFLLMSSFKLNFKS